MTFGKVDFEQTKSQTLVFQISTYFQCKWTDNLTRVFSCEYLTLRTITQPQHNVKFTGCQQVTIIWLHFDTTQNLFPDFVMFDNLQNCNQFLLSSKPQSVYLSNAQQILHGR